MAFIGFQVPAQTARLLSEIVVPGETEAPGHFHITLVVLEKNVPISTIAKATTVAYEVASRTRPFSVQTSRVSHFPSDDTIPVIARIDSDPLHVLHTDLCKALDEAGIEYNKKFPEYKPHVTLAWSKKPIEDIRIPTVEWGAHEMTIWGGDDGDRRIVVTLPFSLKDRAASTRTVTLSPHISASERVVYRFQLAREGLWAT